MLSSLLSLLSSCTLQEPQRPLQQLAPAEYDRASVVVWDKQDPAGTFLVDDADVIAANADVVALRDGKLNMAGSASARYELFVYYGDELRARAHASSARGLELGTLAEAGVTVELNAETLGRDAYRARLAELRAQPRVRYLKEPEDVGADELTYETSLTLPPLRYVATDGKVPGARRNEAYEQIRRRATGMLLDAGVHPHVIAAPGDIAPNGPQAVAERGAALGAYGRPEPLLGTDGEPLRLPEVYVAHAHFAVRTTAEDTAYFHSFDAGALTAGLDDAAAVDEAVAALAEREGWSPERAAAVAPLDVVAWEANGGARAQVRERTWTLVYFRER